MVALPNETRSVPRMRVNGTFMQPHHDLPVCVLGTVLKCDGGGSAFQIKSSDGQTVNVRMNEPLTEPLEGLIEVYGIAQGKSLIRADSYTTFPPEVLAKFDMSSYNEFVNFLNTTENNNPWKA